MENKLKMVGIGIPTYNRPKLLERSLTSIIAQSYTNLEIIISDNNSPNKLEVIEILEKFKEKDDRISYFIQSTNIGPYENFMYVLNKASSPYFMWVADDDYYHPDFIRSCMDVHLRDHNDIGLVFSKYRVKSDSFPIIGDVLFYPNFKFLLDDDSLKRAVQFAALNCFTHKANFYYSIWKKDLLIRVVEETRAYKENVYHGLDIAMITNAVLKAKAFQVDRVLFYKHYAGLSPGATITTFVKGCLSAVKRFLFSIFKYKTRPQLNVNNDIHLSMIEEIFQDHNIPQKEIKRLMEKIRLGQNSFFY